MDFKRFQQAATKTLQPTAPGADPVLVPLLGLAGETGSLATVYKKRLRDGPGFEVGKHQLREELGDVLWYLAALAETLDLDLEDIAAASLAKANDRWRATPDDQLHPFDRNFPEHEQLPRRTTLHFTQIPDDAGRVRVRLARDDGTPAGDPLTSASRVEDGYRFHDAFHLAYAAVLGWSPVTRFLLGCKRRSHSEVDEAEDGGRAIAIEEGISAMVFAYAARHSYLDGINHVDHELLATIGQMTAHLEVSVCRAADWEAAIIVGYTAWRGLCAAGGGSIRLDLDGRTLTLLP
ncbi:nucleoside triphosphate pyrophosphohydrolase family protein [Yinghuangia sp. YIM S09857]|uniref:nucleoside triphosphate pyrophosphohydrolase family protein n=1 Tax=Yinghuangia sp. YIM S09857 TaxID=3436929 RepID=UPI003F533373